MEKGRLCSPTLPMHHYSAGLEGQEDSSKLERRFYLSKLRDTRYSSRSKHNSKMASCVGAATSADGNDGDRGFRVLLL